MRIIKVAAGKVPGARSEVEAMSTQTIGSSFSHAEVVTRAYIANTPACTPDQAITFFLQMHSALQGFPVPIQVQTPEVVEEVELLDAAAPEVAEMSQEDDEGEEADVLEAPVGTAPVETKVYVPAIPLEQSIRADGKIIFCLVDGKPLRMLKRYIMRCFGMTPEAYRAAFGLPDDYPMTAPAYSAQKRKEAQHVGLGRVENKAGVNMRIELADA